MKSLTLSLLFVLSVVHTHAFSDSHETQRRIWVEFLEVIEHKDSNRFSLMALPNIKCISCVDLIDGKDAMMPASEFFKDSASTIFTDRLLSRLKTGKTIYRKGVRQDVSFFEVLVTTTRPGDVGKYHEGAQHAFMFKLKNNEYKFSGLSTIP